MSGRSPDRDGEADVEVLKNRFGPTRTLPPLAFIGDHARFADLVTVP